MVLGTFHHPLDHHFFECNYSRLEIIIEQWTRSFHDATDASNQAFLQKRRKTSAKARNEKKYA